MSDGDGHREQRAGLEGGVLHTTLLGRGRAIWSLAGAVAPIRLSFGSPQDFYTLVGDTRVLDTPVADTVRPKAMPMPRRLTDAVPSMN